MRQIRRVTWRRYGRTTWNRATCKKKKKNHFHRRHLVTAICIVAGIQLTSMAPFIDMCIRVYIPRIMAVWVGTAIVPCCLFDMQRSAVEQLHGPR